MVPKPWPPWPYECFVGFLLDDFGPDNGGTLLVPGSHKIVTAAGEGPLPPLPPTYARRGYTASRTSVFFFFPRRRKAVKEASPCHRRSAVATPCSGGGRWCRGVLRGRYDVAPPAESVVKCLVGGFQSIPFQSTCQVQRDSTGGFSAHLPGDDGARHGREPHRPAAAADHPHRAQSVHADAGRK